MRRAVKLTITAERCLKSLLTHLEMSWSSRIKLKFLNKLNVVIELIRTNPELFPKSEIKAGLHKCVISKQASLFYVHDSETVTILTVFDNRQNPDKLEQEIKEDET